MYHPSLINRSIEQYNHLNPSSPLVEYPIDQVRFYVRHFESLYEYDKKGIPVNFTRRLTPDEIAFINNERELCRCSFIYFCERYCFIEDVLTGEMVLMRLNLAQKAALLIISQMQLQGVPIRMLFLKARQLGVSTLFQLIILHRMLFMPSTTAVVASGDEEKTRSLVEKMVEKRFKMLPWWLVRPDVEFLHSGDEFMTINSAGSRLIVQHGRQKLGIKRGDTANTYHFCFHPQTQVRVADGKLRPISQIFPRDPVIVSDGTLSKTIAAGLSHRKPETAVSLKFWNNPIPLVVSKDHPVLTEDGFKEADILQVGDYVVHPVRQITNKTTSITTIRRPVGSSRFGDRVKTIYPVDHELGWFVGMYLAEGTVVCNAPYRDPQKRPAYVTLSLHQKEISYISTRLRKMFPDVRQREVYSKDSKTAQLILQDNGLAEWVQTTLGSAKDKSFPDDLFNYGQEFCLGLVEGYIEGDGHVKTEFNHIVVTSIRTDLIVQLRDMIAALGLGWSGISIKEAGNWYGRNCQESWNLQITGSTSKNVREALGWETVKPKRRSFDKDKWHWTKDGRIAVKLKLKSYEWCENFWYLSVDHPLHDFTTLQCAVSNTELLEWNDYAGLVEAGFNRAIHSTERTFGVEETTASPRGADFHRYWEDTERDYPQGLTMVRPVFLPYFIGRDIYPPPGEEKSMPVPDNWQVPEFVQEHAAACEEYARTSPVLSQVMPSNWRMDVGQKWWYYREYSKASLDPKKLAQFLAECPANAKEAFQSWQRSIFPIQLMMEYQRRLPQPVLPPLMFDGPDVPEVSKPVLDIGEQPIHTVVYNPHSGHQRMTWKLYGLPFTNYEDELDPLHKLWVWELPTQNQKYVVSMDCGGGLGQDRTVIQVVRIGSPYQPAAQVAEYATDLANAFDCWSVMLMLLQWYSPHKHDGTREYALASIEMAADGRTAQNEIFKRDWPNIYIRQKSDQRRVTPYEQPNLGWDTNQSTRSILVSCIQTFVKRHQVIINSPWVLDELRDFVMHVTKSRDGGVGQIKVQAGRDAHDDRIMALAIGLVTGHELDIYRDDRDPHWIAVAEHAKRQVELAGPVRSSFDVAMPDPGSMLAMIPASEYDTAGMDELANPLY